MPRFPCPTPDQCGVKSHNNPSNCLGTTTYIHSTLNQPDLIVLSSDISMSSIRKLSDGEYSKAINNFIQDDTNVGDQFTVSFKTKSKEDSEFAFDTLNEARYDLENISNEPSFMEYRFDKDDPLRMHVTCNVDFFSQGSKETFDPSPFSDTIRELDGLGLIDENGVTITSHVKQLPENQKLEVESELKNIDWITGVDQGQFGEFYDTSSLSTPNSFKWAMSVKNEDSMVVKLGERDYPTKVDVSKTHYNNGKDEVSYNEDQLNRLLDDGGYTSKDDRELVHQSMKELAKIKMMYV